LVIRRVPKQRLGGGGSKRSEVNANLQKTKKNRYQICLFLFSSDVDLKHGGIPVLRRPWLYDYR